MKIYLSIFILILLFFFINKKEHFFAEYKGIELSHILSKKDIKDLEKGQKILTKMLKIFDGTPMITVF